MLVEAETTDGLRGRSLSSSPKGRNDMLSQLSAVEASVTSRSGRKLVCVRCECAYRTWRTLGRGRTLPNAGPPVPLVTVGKWSAVGGSLSIFRSLLSERGFRVNSEEPKRDVDILGMGLCECLDVRMNDALS